MEQPLECNEAIKVTAGSSKGHSQLPLVVQHGFPPSQLLLWEISTLGNTNEVTPWEDGNIHGHIDGHRREGIASEIFFFRFGKRVV